MKNLQFTSNVFLIIILCMFCPVLFSQVTKEQIAQDAAKVRAYFQQVEAERKNKPAASDATSVSKNDLRGMNKITLDFVDGEKSFLMNGNNIKVDLHNYGGIAAGYPNRDARSISSLIWRQLPYIFQFCPIVGGEVKDSRDSTIHIISDGLFDYDGYREESPTGERWVWKPIPGYADPTQSQIASNPAFDSDHDGKPDSWPREWYNATLGEYVWPGYLSVGVNNADLECYWAMDDRDNKEFKYYPYLNDTTKKGLGLQVDCRAFQWSNSLAANTLFMVYTITNKSDKDIDKAFFGIYGDPDVGGKDNKDDNGYFIPPYGSSVTNIPVYARSMVYFWDNDMKGDGGLPLGYLGCKFLESPGNSSDGIDNDGDGLIDERQDDGIDNDHDWNTKSNDDVGMDGIAGTGDEGENDGKPTAGKKLPDGTPDPLRPGEPNFEYTDLDEVDQIGLTSFNSWKWGDDRIYNDESIWNRCVPGNFGDIEPQNDLTFVYGSGYISLKKGETKRISMAFLFGQDLNDLLTTASTVQDIYNKNYRFFKPPELPTVSAVPGDKKVTLYWDTKAEQSIDPITGQDFEGYVIYRSTDPGFSDILKITDGRGADFLYTPLKGLDGFDAKWDINNGWKGYHPVAYQGRGLQYYLGDNTGLRHSFVDSNNVINGQTYYYAVVAYDHGDSLGIPPSETTKKISVDPITSKLRFDLNTVQVIPGPRAAGYVNPQMPQQEIQHASGYANGSVTFSIMDDLKMRDGSYRLTFSDTLVTADTIMKVKNFTVSTDALITEEFYLYDTNNTKLSQKNIIIDGNLVVKDASGKIYTYLTDYKIDKEKGSIRRSGTTTMPNNSKFSITYKYYPIYGSTAVWGDDSNPVFDGIKLKVSSYSIFDPDADKTKWISGGNNIAWVCSLSTVISALKKTKWPADYRITFSDQYIDTAFFYRPPSSSKKLPVNFMVEDITTGVPVHVGAYVIKPSNSLDTVWRRGDILALLIPGRSIKGNVQDTLTWSLTFPKVKNDTVNMPPAGSVFNLAIMRPFDYRDTYTWKTYAAKIDNKSASDKMSNIYVVPNPYVAMNDLEPANRLLTQNRGERRIYFENLPRRCTIRIFTLAGELVQQLEHDQGMDNGREFWNLLNKDGFSVSYGVYLAHVQAPGVGEKLIKFALIK